MNTRFAMLLAGLLLAAGCQGDTTTPATTADAAALPADQVIYGLRHNMTTDGIRSAVLVGDSAYMREEGRRYDIVGVDLTFFAENGAPSGHLTSETGEYDLRDGSFIARGNAVLVTQGAQGDRRLETEELHYDVAGDQLWSEVPFVLYEDERTTRGTSFRTDGQFETWTVTGAQTEGGIPQAPGASF